MAPRKGFEPSALRLTVECSTIELSRNSTIIIGGQTKVKPPNQFSPGNSLLSHKATPAVPSAYYVLTVLFGMGRGVSHRPLSPDY